MDVKKIIISRTDSIGDVMLTLPVAGVLKSIFPDCKILFLGRSYTKDIAEISIHVDSFHDWTQISSFEQKARIKYLKDLNADVIIHVFPVGEIAFLALKAKIPIRIGTSGRIYHFLTCNKLVTMSRRRSDLHEAQLNLKLIRSLGLLKTIPLNEIQNLYGFRQPDPLDDSFKKIIAKDKFNLILHPKSKGSAREWGLHNFSRLISIIPGDKFRIFITGTQNEGELLKQEIIHMHPEVVDLTGRFTLRQFISFINEADGFISASTGPLHIAAALGKFALGIYPPIVPMHPGRWAPLGKNADYIVADKKCSACRKNKSCLCMENITPEEVYNRLLSLIEKNGKNF
ncbi:MAG: glycosyltransferase family 9 protein [Bacteroidetes bacterium]|nr:glycosyltransferase family 9 protein [Bacteroidota bacterium]